MNIFSKTTSIDFMRRRRVTATLSILAIIISIVSLSTRGLNLGIDFTGGVLLEVGYPEAADLAQIRGTLGVEGFGEAQVQNFGTARDVMIRLLPREGMDSSQLGEEILQVLRASGADVSLRRVEFVGPQVGEELTEDGGLAMLFALLMILGYIMFRFQWKFAVGAVVALIHDVTITLGIFSAFQIPFDLSVLAAILAVIGYSLNDTIVLFDRVRENFRRMRRGTADAIMNSSINQILGRTLITSLTTLLVLTALVWLGGEAVRGFATALIIGVVVGTYSSIYTAGATALALQVSPVDLMPPKKLEDADGLP
ncbi:MAG: protein translocase subunit SecF [Gammaproteobacteria bacterium]|nr:protein translocase subunit SecF [Gammaproteobacteria bacterium]